MSLAEYPYVVVRVRCDLCGRNGQYRLARLADRFGSEAPLASVLLKMTNDCPWRADETTLRKPRKYSPKCGAHFPDLLGPRPPPDMPAALVQWEVVEGGKTG